MVVNQNNRKNNFLVLSDGPTNGYIIKFTLLHYCNIKLTEFANLR